MCIRDRSIQPSGQVPLNQNQLKPVRTYYRSKSSRDINDARSDKCSSENFQQISLKWRPSVAAQLIQSCPLPATSGIGQASPPQQVSESASLIVNVDSLASVPSSSSSSSSSSTSTLASPIAAMQSPVGRPDNAQ